MAPVDHVLKPAAAILRRSDDRAAGAVGNGSAPHHEHQTIATAHRPPLIGGGRCRGTYSCASTSGLFFARRGTPQGDPPFLTCAV